VKVQARFLFRLSLQGIGKILRKQNLVRGFPRASLLRRLQHPLRTGKIYRHKLADTALLHGDTHEAVHA
jgi:hypothetical protein